MKTLNILACLAFLSICTPEAQAQTNKAVILMFGDSITYGIGVEPISTLPEIDDGMGDNFGPSVLELEDLLNKSRRNSLVLNWGYGGSASMHGAFRLQSSIDDSKNKHPAAQYFVLIMYGTNDEGQLSTSATEASIRSMITTARNNAGVTPLLANLPPRSDQNVATRNNIISKIATDMGVPFVDQFSTFTSFSEYFVYEPSFTPPHNFIYLHPNQMGHDMIAMNWFNSELQNLIKPTPVISPIISLLLDDG